MLREIRWKHTTSADDEEFWQVGMFHCWAGLSEYAVAIIEDELGNIHTVSTFDFNIQFMDER